MCVLRIETLWAEHTLLPVQPFLISVCARTFIVGVVGLSL